MDTASSTINCLSIILASAIPLSIIGVLLQRIIAKQGIGVRAIQFVAAITISLIVAILALEGKLNDSTTSGLIGAMIGYLFANISEFKNQKSKNKSRRQNGKNPTKCNEN